MRKYLQLTRAHTAPLEVVPAVIGASLASGSVLNPAVLGWAFYGLLYHLAGYGMNSYSDWKNGFDKEDEYKQHHPLNTGEMSEKTAYETVTFLLLITVVWGVTMAYGSIPALLVLIGGAVAGYFYNEYGKYFDHKWVLITIAHSTVFVAPYIAEGGKANTLTFIAGLAYMISWVGFQIAVSGEVKDIGQRDESNLLREMGAKKMPYGVYFPDEALAFATSLKVVGLVSALGLLLSTGWDAILLAMVIILFLATMYYVSKLLETGFWDRRRRVGYMSIIELITLDMMLVSTLGKVWSVYILGVSIAWVVLFNKIQWGTLITPEV